MLKKLAYVAAGFIIAIALLVTASRLLIPVFDQHRQDFEAWASGFLGMPVQISEARASWYQYQPVITLNNVTILDKASQQPLFHIKKLSVLLSIPQSLWQRKAILSGLVVSGIDVNINEKPNGEIAIQGFAGLGSHLDNKPYTHESQVADVLGWLSQQPRLLLNDVNLSYTDHKNNKRLLTLFNLHFNNDGAYHSLYGKVLLHQEIPTELSATIEWQGSETDINKMDAKLYVYVAKFSLAQWLKGYTYHDWQLNSGIANAKIWAYWHQGAFNKVQSTFEAYGLNLFSSLDKSTHKIARLSADVGWKREGNQQIFAGDDIFIDLPNHLWPSTNFYVVMDTAADASLHPITVNFGYLDLKDAQQFLASSQALLPTELLQQLKNLQLQGEIQSLSSSFSGELSDISKIALTSHFAHLSVSPWQKFPGIKNLSGVLNWHATQGDLDLQSSQTILNYNSVFANPIVMDHLIGNIAFKQDEKKDWLLTFSKIHGMNQDLTIDLDGGLQLLANGAPHIDIAANFNLHHVENVTSYLPLKVFEPGLNEWLLNAFKSGVIPAGTAKIKGDLKDFPFENGNGEFLVTAKVRDLDFHYAPDWPNLKNVVGEVTFSGIKMQAHLQHTDIMGIAIENVQGVIPNLGGDKPAILTVSTDLVKMDSKQGVTFVHSSPLEKTIGHMFVNMLLTGPMTLQLGLTVPLATPDNTTVVGDITFKDADMDLDAWQLQASKLQGAVHFTEKEVSAKSVHGVLFKKPFTLDITTLTHNQVHNITRATVINHIAVADLETWLKIPFAKVIKGATDVTAEIDFQLDAPTNLHVRSDLIGINVLLPDQYAKAANISKKFTADLIIADKQPIKMKANYGKLLDAAVILDRNKETFDLSALNISLGAGSAAWPVDDGLYISGEIPKLQWEKIQELASGTGKNGYADLPLRGIDVHIGRLELPAQVLTNARIQATPGTNVWDINLDSNEIDGRIQWPVKMTPQSTVVLQLQKLNLTALSSQDSKVNKIDSKTLPAISFTANRVTYNNLPLGQVSFKTVPKGNGLAIQAFTVNSSQLSLSATGSWQGSNTTLKGSATTGNVSHLLESLGFDVHNFIASKGKVDFQFSWSKPPYALALAAMNGTSAIDIAQGRIVEISQTSGAKMDLGRMLSIFSLQTIPRRLSLDFSDVFQKGYSFDTFRGDFRFENGNAYTNNTHFNGPVARVGINGRIGLASKDYDFTLSVIPHVTSSIPVAATLLTGQPAIGLAAWAVDKVLSSGVNKATSYYYAVSGPWSNPAWNAIKVPAQ